MNSLVQTLRNLGPARLLAMGAMLIGMVAFFGWLATRSGGSDMVLLYSDLAGSDAAAIGAQLDAEKITYTVSAQGNSIMVPADQVGKIRMKLAETGLPRGGSIGYEIFDQPEGFGTTSFVQDINHLRALEGELARTVGALDPVAQARVHLVLPHHELFSQVEQKASASVFLKLRSNGGLSKEQIAAIQNLIAAAVPQLSPTQISIVDDHGNLLARPQNDNDFAGAAESQEEMTTSFEQAQAQKIEDILSRTLGEGRVRAQVSADMGYDKLTTNSETYDPDSQVARSSQTVSEDSNSSDGGDAALSNANAGGPVTSANSLPGANNGGGDSGGTSTKNSRTEETKNYEINRTVKNVVSDSGQLRRLSVAVVVDGTYDTDKDGKQTYKPRSTEEMDQIKALVKSAVDFDPKRGDTLEVANMRFSEPDLGPAPTSDLVMGFQRSDIVHLAETSVLAVVGLLVMLLVVRPVLRRAFDAAAPVNMAGHLLSASAGVSAQLPGPANSYIPSSAGEPEMQIDQPSEIEQMIDIGRVEGRVRASAVKKVGEIIDKHPEESVSILRNWMYQEQ